MVQLKRNLLSMALASATLMLSAQVQAQALQIPVAGYYAAAAATALAAAAAVERPRLGRFFRRYVRKGILAHVPPSGRRLLQQ